MAFLVWTSLLIFFLRIWLSLYGGIHPDEAYYWVWAQHLRLGYFDHPPMVAYLIRLGQEVFETFFKGNYSGAKSHLILSLRWLPDFLGFVLLPCLIGGAVKEYQRRRLTLSQVFAILSAPIVIFGAQIITPDLPLMVIWTGAFWLAMKMKRKLRHNTKTGAATKFSWGFSLGTGIVWALGAYSKYTAIFLPLLFIISGIGFWNSFAAGITCFILTFPYLYWTLTEALPNRMGIFYQLDRGTRIMGTEAHLNWVGDMWAAQLVFWSPVFCLDYIFSFKHRRKMSWSMGAWIFLPLIFFSITGLRNRPEANWPIMGGIALAVFVIARHARHPIRLFWFTASNYLLVIVALWAMLNQNKVGELIAPFSKEKGESLSSKVSRVEEFRGWENLRNFVFESTLVDHDPIVVEKYHVLSPLLFFDKSAGEDEKLGSRLKIDHIPGKSVSQFHFEPAYEPDYNQNYWFLKKGESAPSEKKCVLSEMLVKADERGEPFALFKCSPSHVN